MHHLRQRNVFKLPRRVLTNSSSVLNGPSTDPGEAGSSSSSLKTKTSLSYFSVTTASPILWTILLILLFRSATDSLSLIFFIHWVAMLQPFFQRCRTPNRLVPLPRTKPHRQASLPFAYPASYLLTSTYMLLMSFVGFLLALARLGGFTLVVNPLMERQHPDVPPEPEPDPHDFLPRRSRKAPAKRLLHLGLMAAIAASDAIPVLGLKSDKTLKRDLQKHRSASGFVTKTSTIQPPALSRLRTVLEASQCHLLSKDDHFELIVDSGCSKSVSPCLSDFVPGSLVDLPSPLSLDGIAGQLIAHQRGRLRYEILNDAGGVTTLECEGYYLPGLKIRLFSPQILLGEHQGGQFVLEWDKSYFSLANGDRITIGYHRQTSLPVIRGFHNVLATAQSLALEGISDQTTSNLTSLQQRLFLWHTKWGHLGWQHTQWLGRCGLVGSLGIKMGSTTVQPPKCAACQLGKQERTPKGGTTLVKAPEGVLKLNKLAPGDLVFSDQYESPLLGRQFSARGNDLTTQQFRGGTIFCDAASAKLSVIHQVQAKLRFEREAAAAGVHVRAYCTDNGIYTSKEFAAELSSKGQGIKHSGVGGHHHNGVAENAIKNTVRTGRTMMIYAALRWPEHNQRDLWPLALSHAVSLHNELPTQSSRLTPHEVWSRSKSSFSAVVNAHPWGCPVYVLQPRLQDGGKVPKWEPRSRQGQYMGSSPLHASTVGLIRNLQTNHISPQFHVVYDDLFDTVHASALEAPASWPDLFAFSRFKSDYDDADFVPTLPDEWLTPVELTQRQQQEQAHRSQDGANAVDESHIPEPDDEMQPQRAPPDASQRAPTEVAFDFPEPPTPDSPQRALPTPDIPPELPADPHTPVRRYPTRNRRAPVRLHQHGYSVVRSYCRAMVGALLLTQGQAYDNRYLLNLLLDHDFGLYENLSPNSLMMAPHAMKASATHDPDTPRLHEAMRGEHRDEFLAAMGKEIAELEAHGTWKIVRKESMPDGANLLPSTWALKIKRYPDGRMRKNKARFCVRGDKQIAGVDYFESYAPVASWSTVRMVMNLAIQRNWATRQVDFSNAFVQAELKEEVYVELPEMFRDEHNHGSTNGVVLKLNKSLYGLVQAPLSWYNHLQKGLNELDFKVSALDPGMYYGRGMILITYVDDTLFFGPDIKAIEKVISELEGLGYGLTREEGDETTAFAFLGVSILPDPVTKMLKLTQRGLILKVLAATGMSECNTKGSPALSTPLGTNADGPRRKETWHYASVIGMLMYLSSNAHPEIQFSVHQCARFTHCPRASHEEAVKHICRYLQGAKDEGLRFKPTDDLQLDCYVDADFAGLWNYESDQDPVCVKSRTGYVMTLGGCPIQWNSKLQTEIALSTTEAEYIALSQAMRELIPLRRLLLEIVTEMKLPGITDSVIKSTVFEDNNGAISTATAVKMTPRTKHIAVKYHFFKSYLHAGTGITIAKIDTNLQKADIFTKGLAPHKFAEIRKLLCDW
jgi:hypothetical protein